MNKEELEKFTVDFMNNETSTNWSRIDSIMGKMLIKYAEVFQKHIAELEKENAELKKKLKEKLKTIADKDLSFVARFDALAEENAELKLKLEALEGQTPWKDIKDKSEVIGKLTKAKEIIKELVRVEYADFTNGDYSNELSKVLEQAEQFLKEIKE